MLAIISHIDCMYHDAGEDHPENADRIHAINNQLISSGLEFVLSHYDAPLVKKKQLLRVHDEAYIERIFAMAPTQGSVEIDGDTVMSPGTLQAAQRAAGAGVLGTNLIMKKEAGPVFCMVRPPGHHAEHDKAMGFCLFNNVAAAAAHALKKHGLERVAIVDFDVHHGNGTESIFKDNKQVLFCSSFQHPFYPYTGHESDTANLIDVPLPSGTKGTEFRQAITEHWLPALNDFRPQLLFISAGFDAHMLDDMGGLNLTESDYAWVTQELVKVANKHAEGRIVSMLEGGYNPAALSRSVVSHIKALLA